MSRSTLFRLAVVLILTAAALFARPQRSEAMTTICWQGCNEDVRCWQPVEDLNWECEIAGGADCLAYYCINYECSGQGRVKLVCTWYGVYPIE